MVGPVRCRWPMLSGGLCKGPPSNTLLPKMSGRAPPRKGGACGRTPVGLLWEAVGLPWKYREKAVKTPWEGRVIPTPGAVATATLTAEDGHEVTADLYQKPGEPFSLMVVAHPRPAMVPPGEPGDVSRHPTFAEVIDAADLLAPGGVFQIMFVACPKGVEREPVEVGGALGVQADQVGIATKSPLILARA